MNEDLNMPRRVRVIFRVLAILSFVEGLGGVLLTIMNAKMVPIYITSDVLSVNSNQVARLLYAVSYISLPFNCMLLVAGVFLWKVQRRGLSVLAWIIIVELASVTAAALIGAVRTMHGHEIPDLGFFLGVAIFPVGLQVITAFPVVAGILIFFAYRYIGIPTRQLG
jgi:hypothetical protein